MSQSTMRILSGTALVLLTLVAPAAAQTTSGFGDCVTRNLPRMRPEEVRPGVTRQVLEGIELSCDGGNLLLYADRAETLTGSDWVDLSGRVTLVRPDITLIAASARFNHKLRTGSFVDVHGYARIHDSPVDKGAFGGGEPDFSFTAKRVEKTGPDSYELEGATVTSCMQPIARWMLGGSSGSFVVGDHVSIRNAVLWVKGVPLLYVPFFRYPISREERSTGFLMPSMGSNTVGGFSLSNAFFWAIARSQDATLFHDFYPSGTTQGFGAEYRYMAAPGSSGNMLFYVRNQEARLAADGISVTPAQRTYDLRGTISQELPRGFRLNGTVNYYTDARTQQLFQQDPFAATDSRRQIIADLTGRIRRVRLHARFDQTDVFSTLATASRIGQAPRVAVDLPGGPLFGRRVTASGQPSWISRVNYSAGVSATRSVQQTDLTRPETSRTLWRGEARTNVSMPLPMPDFLDASVSTRWQGQYWTNSQDASTLELLGRPIGRQHLTVNAELRGPSFAQIWRPNNSYAEAWKHVIEPSFTYSWASPFSGFSNLVQTGAAEAFISSQATYELANVFLARRRVAGGTSVPREIIRVRLRQEVYLDERAAAFDPDFQTIPGLRQPSRFSPLSLETVVMPTDRISANVRADFDAKTRGLQELTASGTLRSRAVDLRASWSRITPLLNPFFPRNSVTVSANRNAGRFGGGYDVTLDLQEGRWRYQRFRGFYNAQCCGVTVDYGIHDISHLNFNVPRNTTLGITFSLAGIGSFVTPLGGFGR
jgi:LPS-assembly protein